MAVDRYREICAAHRWNVPAEFNIAHACCARWANDRSRFALYWEDESGATRRVHVLGPAAEREPAVQRARGAGHRARRQDRARSFRSGRKPSSRTWPPTSWAPLPCRCPSCSAPRRSNTGWSIPRRGSPSSTRSRSRTSRRSATAAPASPMSSASPARARRGSRPTSRCWRRRRAISRPSRRRAGDPALLVYTSGTTGPPKGALMPQQCLLGNLPGFVHSHDGYPREGDLFWSPADWAWTGGLMDALLPALVFRPADRRLSRPVRSGPRARR